MRLSPVYTEETECHDCYKCLRQCPVKAIKVAGGRASIVPELCIVCGLCVAACPSKAKQVRDDLGLVRNLLEEKERVYVSLAPSWAGEFAGIEPGRLIAALRQLGFAGVGETALGAQQVSVAVAEQLEREESKLFLSTACPAAVDYIQGYLPDYAPYLTKLHSPVLAHCEILRKSFGKDIGVVFFGPCVAKKGEADKHPELLDAALTFQDLRRWLAEEEIDIYEVEAKEDDRFVPEQAKEGARYPVEGGMIDTIKIFKGTEKVRFITLAGIPAIEGAIRKLDVSRLSSPVFAEILACAGGCVRGPCSSGERPWLIDQLAVLDRAPLPRAGIERPRLIVPVEEGREAVPCDFPVYSVECIQGAMAMIGKSQPEDELNCGGCGYTSCRALAEALLEGLAEPSMCVHFLRKRALRKANALLRCIPAGVVIVDERMHIVECNMPFARLFGDDVMIAYNARPGMEGASLAKIIPFTDMFRNTLASGKDYHCDGLRIDNRVLNVTVFIIEPGQTVGGVIFDVTGAELHRDMIAQRAREIIRKNLETVQEIACRLGENMADTEILLRSLSEGFSSDSREKPEAALKRITAPPRGRSRHE